MVEPSLLCPARVDPMPFVDSLSAVLARPSTPLPLAGSEASGARSRGWGSTRAVPMPPPLSPALPRKGGGSTLPLRVHLVRATFRSRNQALDQAPVLHLKAAAIDVRHHEMRAEDFRREIGDRIVVAGMQRHRRTACNRRGIFQRRAAIGDVGIGGL